MLLNFLESCICRYTALYNVHVLFAVVLVADTAWNCCRSEPGLSWASTGLGAGVPQVPRADGRLQRLGGERREGTALLHGVWRRNKTNWGRGVTVLTQKVSNCYIYIWVQSLNCSWSRQIYIPSKHCCILFPSSFLPAAINLDALVDINIQSFKEFF